MKELFWRHPEEGEKKQAYFIKKVRYRLIQKIEKNAGKKRRIQNKRKIKLK